MLKRMFSIFAISLIITGLFFEGYSLKCPVFADDTTDGWLNVTTNEQLVEAFKYYCKSRDLTIEGSAADAVTSFTTKTFNGICNTLGIDITALQAQLKYRTDGNQGLQFLFTTTGVNAYNQIFAQFLQDNNLSVGDSANETNNTVYSGQLFTDADGNTALVYIYNNSNFNFNESSIIAHGTPYKYYSSQIVDLVGNSSAVLNFHLNSGETKTKTMYYYSSNLYPKLISDQNNGGYSKYAYLEQNSNNVISKYEGWPIILKRSTNNNYYFGWTQVFVSNGNRLYEIESSFVPISGNTSNATVFLTTNNTVINNNTYEGDTIINNEGDIINNYPDNPDNPDLPPSNPSVPDSGGWQDFQMPSMPNDWLIYGMEKKFPFDIPFNIMFGLSLLNHEPEIPKFEGDIDLKVCTWHYDIDLTPFDDIAKILRKFEVLAFIIGLAMLTKELIMWG